MTKIGLADGTDFSTRGVVVLGVTGSIAAYKAADLTSKLVQIGVEVHVVMTASAAKLVQPQTFLTLSRHPVLTDLWAVPEWRPEHIALAESAQLLLVAPATANFLGKFAHGIADDALTTVALSHEGPVIVAPAMNPRMWRHAAVQESVRLLRLRGVKIIGPAAGRVACSGDGEAGRMVAVEQLLAAVLVELASLGTTAEEEKSVPHLKVVVTAGPTREDIDPVRFISNRSSGRMGYALAAVSAAAGHETLLITGPTQLPRPVGCRCEEVTSAAEMSAAVKRAFPEADILFMCAAVSDYRPRQVAVRKIKKEDGPAILELERTEDILATVSGLKSAHQKIVGFAAETDDLEVNARKKLLGKKLDWLAANDVSRADIGFGAEENEVILYSADGRAEHLPRMSKLALAAEILHRVCATAD